MLGFVDNILTLWDMPLTSFLTEVSTTTGTLHVVRRDRRRCCLCLSVRATTPATARHVCGQQLVQWNAGLLALFFHLGDEFRLFHGFSERQTVCFPLGHRFCLLLPLG
jgi:hypothetical protein